MSISPNYVLAGALERHRDDEPPRLEFRVPLDRLMDSAHCQTLSDDLRRVAPAGWESVRATPTAWRKIPPEPGLYMFVWQPNLKLQTANPKAGQVSFPWILYIGKAGDSDNRNTLKSRYKGEYSRLVGTDPDGLWSPGDPATREERLKRFLRIVPLYFWYCTVEDRSIIKALETRLYALFSPPLNTAGSRRLRPVGKPKPAF